MGDAITAIWMDILFVTIKGNGWRYNRYMDGYIACYKYKGYNR